MLGSPESGLSNYNAAGNLWILSANASNGQDFNSQ